MKHAAQKLTALFLALALMLSMVSGGTAYAASSSSKKVTKMTVKTTSTMLNEGQVLTKTMLKKSLNVTAKLKNGKTKKKYTSYTSKQIGKTIKSNSKGNYKVTITAGSAKKTVSIKVNRIKKIYVKKCNMKSLTEGQKFDAKAFKSKTTVYADYKKGADKKLTTYTVSAPKTVKANSKGKFVVTLKYGSKKTTVSIPVTKEPTTEEPPTEDPSAGGTTPTEVKWLYFYDNQYKLFSRSLSVGIYTAIDLPQEYSSIDEWGFIYTYTTAEVNDNDMVFGNTSTKAVGDHLSTDKIQKSSYTLNFSQDLWEKNTTVKVRIFAKVKKDGKTETVYSNVLHVKLDLTAK